jgi:hypothetical protein
MTTSAEDAALAVADAAREAGGTFEGSAGGGEADGDTTGVPQPATKPSSRVGSTKQSDGRRRVTAEA